VAASPLLARLAEEPLEAGLLLDVDGALAPIVPRPEDARVPAETRRELARLAGRYALVACVTGRAAADARRIVGVDDLVYVGVHGLELAPEAARWREPLRNLLSSTEWPRAEVEDKGVTVSFHYRSAPDEEAARAALERVADRARAGGLQARFGRKVLEVLPPVEANKGTAVRRLLAERSLRRALYAGDDTTDLDGFAALDRLDVAVRVAVASDEGPAELRTAADVVVGSPADLVTLLRAL
jgi:trehalose 6-phosphate phosphatase